MQIQDRVNNPVIILKFLILIFETKKTMILSDCYGYLFWKYTYVAPNVDDVWGCVQQATLFFFYSEMFAQYLFAKCTSGTKWGVSTCVFSKWPRLSIEAFTGWRTNAR